MLRTLYSCSFCFTICTSRLGFGPSEGTHSSGACPGAEFVSQSLSFHLSEEGESHSLGLLCAEPSSLATVLRPKVQRESPDSLKLDGDETILVVDDEELVRLVIRILACRGYQVSTAIDGEDAIEKCSVAPARLTSWAFQE